MTGRPGDRTMEMKGPCVLASLNRSGIKGAFRFPGATWDHFRVAVEPLHGDSQCRVCLDVTIPLSPSWRLSWQFPRWSFEIGVLLRDLH